MRAYQLATLAAAFCSDFTLGAPAPAANPQVNYVSKYPQHPVNLGYGDNYPKYWQDEAYNPAEFPPIVQPRVPFYPYPYSNAWKSTSPPSTSEEVDVKVVEQPKYTPPYGFPSSKTPAKDAIQAYSNAAQRAAEEAAAAEEQPPAPRAKAAGTPSLVKEQDRGKSSKNLKFTGEGGEGDGTGYTKVINNPRKTSSKDGGNSGDSDWNQFSYGVVSDTLVHHDPYDEALVDGERRTNAMGKIQKLLGGNGNANWYENLHKRDLDSGLEKRERGWPDHIQVKADKMMKSAAAMQDRGQTLMDNDQYKAKKEPQAAPAASAAPAREQEKKAVPGSGAKSSNKNAPQPSTAPSKKKDDDPMMRKELPKSSGNTKKPNQPKPNQPKQSRPSPPTKQKPARGGKNQRYQENSPRQQRGNAPRIQTLEKRDAAPEPAAVADPEAVKGRSGDKVSPNKGGKNASRPEGGKGKGGKGGKSPQQIDNNNKGGKPPKGPGGIRPNKINQSRPKKNKAGAGKGKAVAMAMEEDICEHFEDGYVENIIYEMCEAEVEEEESGLQKRQAVNRKVLPCGPPVTIRRVLGAEAAPTPAPVAVVNPVTNGPIYAAQGLGVNQIADGQIQIQAPRYQAPVQVAPVQVAPAPARVVVTQTVQQQVQVPGPTQYVTKAVQVPVPGPTQVVKELVEKVVEKPVVQTVVQTVVQNVPYAVTRTQQVPYAVTQTQQVQVTQQVNVPYPVTKVQNIPYPVTQTQKVQVTQQVTKAVPYPVTQTQKVFETIVPQVKVTPKEREIIHEKVIHGSKNVVENVDVIKKVPVMKTFLVCPLCEQPEGKCSCGTFPAAEPNAAPVVAEYKGPASGLEDVARTAKDIEAFFKAQLPEGILAQ
ncbi:hypothetical protein BDD12DRAFT_10917 [Trichophaea hybrida]|nr:hypothetical protein BDD12DRAFT_10917 [Trichophaea hybrida]